MADQTKAAGPNQTVYLPHTITNTGNGPDTYRLDLTQLTGDTGDFSTIKIFADDNGDGVPDNGTDISASLFDLPYQGVKKIVIAALIPSTAVSGDQYKLDIKVTSTTDGTATDHNVDTVNVTTDANVPVTKRPRRGRLDRCHTCSASIHAFVRSLIVLQAPLKNSAPRPVG